MVVEALEKAKNIQSTMLLPLWGRAEVSRRYPDLLSDSEAVSIINGLSHDFSGIAESFGEYGMLNFAIRARKFDDALKDFLTLHPEATIVNIGAGLDTTFQRVDNGKIQWYDLDLPDAIAFRESLIPTGFRNRSIAKSMFDESWFDDVAFDPARGILFLAGGVFYYFEPSQIQALIRGMAERFPGGELVFDAASAFGMKISSRMVKNAGNLGAEMLFSLRNPNDMRSWSHRISAVQAKPYHGGIPIDKAWKLTTRLGLRLGDLFRMLWIVRVRFKMEGER